MAHIFNEQAALVTGAASGIGLAVAHMLADGSVGRLVLNDCDAGRLGQARDALARPGLAIDLLPGSVDDPALWEQAAPLLRGITLGVANAGIADNGAIDAMGFDAWRRVLGVNLDGCFLSLQAMMRAMIAGERGGSIIVTASVSGMKAEPGTAAYAASKAAALHLMRVAAKEGAPHRIRVNAIAPGGVETPIWSTTPFFRDMVADLGSEEAAYAALAEGTPLGRFARAEEIAAQAGFLLSAAPGPTTGTVLVCDGGYSL